MKNEPVDKLRKILTHLIPTKKFKTKTIKNCMGIFVY